MKVYTVAQIEANSFFKDDKNLKYCNKHAMYKHNKKDNPTAFMFYVYQHDSRIDVAEYNRMKKEGCTDDFIEAYIQAVSLGVFVVEFVKF